MNTTLRRGAVAVATTLACLALAASPASALTTHSATVTGGTLVLTNTFGNPGFIGTLPLAGTAGTACGATAFLEEDAGTGTVDIAGYRSASRFTLSTSTTQYIAKMTRLSSTPGTFSGGTITSLSVTMRIDIHLPADPSPSTTCEEGATRTCRYTTTLTLSGTYTGWTPSNTVSLAASTSTIAVTPPCAVPFTEYNGGSAAATSWAFQLTT